jgi:hypothetical protein
MLAQLNTTLLIARHLISFSLFIFLVVFSTKALSTDPVEKVIFFGASGKYSFKNDVFLKQLNLALTKTKPKFGGYTLSQADMDLKQGRAVEEMHTSCPFDLIWLVSDNRRERDLIPVRIPLLKGLFGLRAPMLQCSNAPYRLTASVRENCIL